MAQVFFSDIIRLHGVPRSIVSDRDPVFTSSFWSKIMRLMGTKLHLSSVFHPQPDGQTAAANHVIVIYLRCFTGDRPRQWLGWLLWAEYIYNTTYQTSLRDTSFRVVYGRDPPSIRSYEPGEARVEMEAREAFLDDVRYRLRQAQTIQKCHYDRTHRLVTYQVGDWALLRLRQWAAASLPCTTAGKLKPRYVGPYHVTDLINDVAVRLALPRDTRLHDIFHTGVLKKFVVAPPGSPPELPPILDGAVVPEPAKVLHARLARGVRQVLVQWRGELEDFASWEDLDDFRDRYPAFQLEDELVFEDGRDVMYDRAYIRQQRARDVRRALERTDRAQEVPAAGTSG
jgi:hypothetical protein